jgi:hypothetical protein
MSDFLDDCRREWRRLRVPDPIAEEMAADLAADLEQARVEGVAAEEVLGTGVFDPRGFAADWATQRGVIPDSLPPSRPRRRWLALAGFACSAVLIALGAAMAVLAFHGANVAGVARAASPTHLVSPIQGFTHPVGPPAPDLRPLALALLAIGLLGVASTTVLWIRWSPRGGGGARIPGLG